jgi:hypothetical protein
VQQLRKICHRTLFLIQPGHTFFLIFHVVHEPFNEYSNNSLQLRIHDAVPLFQATRHLIRLQTASIELKLSCFFFFRAVVALRGIASCSSTGVPLTQLTLHCTLSPTALRFHLPPPPLDASALAAQLTRSHPGVEAASCSVPISCSLELQQPDQFHSNAPCPLFRQVAHSSGTQSLSTGECICPRTGGAAREIESSAAITAASVRQFHLTPTLLFAAPAGRSASS